MTLDNRFLFNEWLALVGAWKEVELSRAASGRVNEGSTAQDRRQTDRREEMIEVVGDADARLPRGGHKSIVDGRKPSLNQKEVSSPYKKETIRRLVLCLTPHILHIVLGHSFLLPFDAFFLCQPGHTSFSHDPVLLLRPELPFCFSHSALSLLTGRETPLSPCRPRLGHYRPPLYPVDTATYPVFSA